MKHHEIDASKQQNITMLSDLLLKPHTKKHYLFDLETAKVVAYYINNLHSRAASNNRCINIKASFWLNGTSVVAFSRNDSQWTKKETPILTALELSHIAGQENLDVNEIVLNAAPDMNHPLFQEIKTELLPILNN